MGVGAFDAQGKQHVNTVRPPLHFKSDGKSNSMATNKG